MSTTTPKRSDKRQHAPARRQVWIYIALVVTCLLMILPLVWMALSSFKTRAEIISQPIDWLPSSLNPENYILAAQQIPIVRMFLNTVLVTAVGSSIKLFLAIITAYALVFIKFPAKRLIFILILVALMVPPEVSLLPNYGLIAGLGGKNTYWGIILPGLGTAFGTFLLRQYFLMLPYAVIESAAIDGAGHWKRLWKIIVPMSLPSIITVGLITIVTEWNNFLWPLVITDNPKFMTLPVGLALLQNTDPGSVNWGVLMASTVIILLPVIIIFAFLQRFIVAGLTQGALK